MDTRRLPWSTGVLGLLVLVVITNAEDKQLTITNLEATEHGPFLQKLITPAVESGALQRQKRTFGKLIGGGWGRGYGGGGCGYGCGGGGGGGGYYPAKVIEVTVVKGGGGGGGWGGHGGGGGGCGYGGCGGSQPVYQNPGGGGGGYCSTCGGGYGGSGSYSQSSAQSSSGSWNYGKK